MNDQTQLPDLTRLIDRYIDAWNETDAGRRRDLIVRTYAEDARYLDPAGQGCGQDAIGAMILGVQQRFPGHSFRRTSEVDAHNDRARFNWELAPADGPPIVRGIDFVEHADGRLRAVTGFFEPAAG